MAKKKPGKKFPAPLKVTFRGKTQSLRAWARELDIPITTLHYRFRNGWSITKAFNTSPRTTKKYLRKVKPGKRLNNWEVLDIEDGVRGRKALCKCHCNNSQCNQQPRLIAIYDLKRGKSKSCGCYETMSYRSNAIIGEGRYRATRTG